MKVGDRVKVARLLVAHEDMLQWLVGKEGDLVYIDTASPEYGVKFDDGEDDEIYFYEGELEVLA